MSQSQKCLALAYFMVYFDFLWLPDNYWHAVIKGKDDKKKSIFGLYYWRLSNGEIAVSSYHEVDESGLPSFKEDVKVERGEVDDDVFEWSQWSQVGVGE